MRNQISKIKLPLRQIDGQGRAGAGQNFIPLMQLPANRLQRLAAQVDGEPGLLGQGQQVAETRHRAVFPLPAEHGLEAFQFSGLKTEDRLIPDLEKALLQYLAQLPLALLEAGNMHLQLLVEDIEAPSAVLLGAIHGKVGIADEQLRSEERRAGKECRSR